MTVMHCAISITDDWLKIMWVLGGTAEGSVMEATPPATPRHTMFPLWLLPSGSDQVHG
ncbi:hypothetical protein METHPM2_80078 [Pseudomonas sp. PM2]